MTAAIALAVVLVIAVAGMSLAMQTQRPAQARTARPSRPSPPPRRASRSERRAATQPPAPAPAPETTPKGDEPKSPELLRSGKVADAKVLGVVDERTTGTIVRSRLNLRVEPAGGEPFEVQVRHAFPTLAARSAVRVGGTVPVRYDPDDHARVVIVSEG